MKTTAEVLACAERELQLRRNVYPRWIANGRLTEGKAAHEIECMERICQLLARLKMLEEVSEEIKARPPKQQAP